MIMGDTIIRLSGIWFRSAEFDSAQSQTKLNSFRLVSD